MRQQRAQAESAKRDEIMRGIGIQKAKAALDLAEARVNFAEQNFARARDLVAKGNLSTDEMAQREMALHEAHAARDIAQADFQAVQTGAGSPRPAPALLGGAPGTDRPG